MNVYEILSVQVVGNFCMDLAMKKAKTVGIGWVTCTGEECVHQISYIQVNTLLQLQAQTISE